MATVERTDLDKALKAEGISVVGGKVKLSDRDRAISVAKTLVKAEAEPRDLHGFVKSGNGYSYIKRLKDDISVVVYPEVVPGPKGDKWEVSVHWMADTNDEEDIAEGTAGSLEEALRMGAEAGDRAVAEEWADMGPDKDYPLQLPVPDLGTHRHGRSEETKNLRQLSISPQNLPTSERFESGST